MKKPKGKKDEEKNNELYMQQVHRDREREELGIKKSIKEREQ